MYYCTSKMDLDDPDDNVFAILGRVVKKMKKEGISQEYRERYIKDIFASGSYENALRITREYVDLC